MLVTEVMGVHGANPVSGDFSVGAAGFFLKGGEIAHPTKGIAIAGNLLELLGGATWSPMTCAFSARSARRRCASASWM